MYEAWTDAPPMPLIGLRLRCKQVLAIPKDDGARQYAPTKFSMAQPLLTCQFWPFRDKSRKFLRGLTNCEWTISSCSPLSGAEGRPRSPNSSRHKFPVARNYPSDLMNQHAQIHRIIRPDNIGDMVAAPGHGDPNAQRRDAVITGGWRCGASQYYVTTKVLVRTPTATVPTRCSTRSTATAGEGANSPSLCGRGKVLRRSVCLHGSIRLPPTEPFLRRSLSLINPMYLNFCTR
jgi:hypothetical protein